MIHHLLLSSNRAKRTTKKALCWIASTWIISSLLWPPWIFYWPHYEGIVFDNQLPVVNRKFTN